jgi:hypothetical protein
MRIQYQVLALAIMPLQALCQCPIEVDAGPDQFTCYPPDQVTLNGSVEGSYLSFTWTPNTGMVGANSLSPSVTPNSTTDYVLNVTALTDNLIVNGDFELGNTGFSTDYGYDPNTTSGLNGEYEINTVPFYFDYDSCHDHTTGFGNYMIAGADFIPDQNVWCESVPVLPNTDYVFSAWAIHLISYNSA